MKKSKLSKIKKEIDERNQKNNMFPEDFKAMKIGETVEQYKKRRGSI